ncbi:MULTISPECIES: MFS transporter [Nocardioides]|uniref:MFS transporter n=1 Tax=Nocardioides vastitatis TaxID=2568655 RepID=A0ABW0ZKJ7_9ACTN|nr:MFS transporter [Nocardioides sp.]THJ14733.1 MFS transporter [Nocardioides sp.]
MASRLAPWLRVASAMTCVGWGANQFAGLLEVYRGTGHRSEAFVSSAVGVYAAGLIPALLVVAAISNRVDRRTPVRWSVLLSAAGSVLIMAGAEHDWLVLLGRFVAGVATGAVLAPGTAWLMDLSPADSSGTGARRATVALSLGFGGGPLVAGLVAQWSPSPAVLPYTVHLLLAAVTGTLLWSTPVEPARRDACPRAVAGPGRWAGARAVLRQREFLGVVPLTAPWVFGTATTAFAIAPTAVHVATLPIATNAVVTGTTLVAGVGIQPLGKRMEHHARGRTLWVGMALAAVGLLLTAVMFVAPHVWMLFLVAPLLGGAYGLLMVGGLSRVEVLTKPDDRATVNAVFYALTYLGFAAPYLFVLLTQQVVGATTLLGLGTLVAAASALAVVGQRRTPRTEPTG